MEREQERNLEIPPQARRLRYLLLPKGLTEKTRLAAGFMGRSLTLHRRRPRLRFFIGDVRDRELLVRAMHTVFCPTASRAL
jgi:hypothetical protein